MRQLWHKHILSKHKHEKKYYSYWLPKQCCLVTIYLTNNSAKQRAYSSKTSLSNTPALQVLFCVCGYTHKKFLWFQQHFSDCIYLPKCLFLVWVKQMTKSRERKPARKMNRRDLGKASCVIVGERWLLLQKSCLEKQLNSGLPNHLPAESVQLWLLFRRLAYEKAQSQMPKAQVKTMLHYSQCSQTRNWSI